MGGSWQRSSQKLGAEVASDKMATQYRLPEVPVDGLELVNSETIKRAKMIQEGRIKQATLQNREMTGGDGPVGMAEMDLGPRSHGDRVRIKGSRRNENRSQLITPDVQLNREGERGKRGAIILMATDVEQTEAAWMKSFQIQQSSSQVKI